MMTAAVATPVAAAIKIDTLHFTVACWTVHITVAMIQFVGDSHVIYSDACAKRTHDTRAIPRPYRCGCTVGVCARARLPLAIYVIDPADRYVRGFDMEIFAPCDL